VQALRFENGVETRKKRKVIEEDDSGLSQFLIDRSVANPLLGTSFHWYLMIECDTRSPVGKAYAKVAFRFMQKLSEVSRSVKMPRNARLTCRPKGALRSETFFDVKESSLSCFRLGRKRFEARKMVDRKRSKSYEALSATVKTDYHHCRHLYLFHWTPVSLLHRLPPTNLQFSSRTSTHYSYGSRRPRWSLMRS
jgi:hypothetical protein